MKNFSQLITEPDVNQRADTKEFVGLFLTAMVLSYACGPLLGGGNKDSKGGSGASFWDFLIAHQQMKQDKKKEEEDKKSESGKGESKNNEAFNSLLLLSRQANEKEKDENTKKKNDAMIKLLTACSFDKDGNEIPLEERMDKMKDTMSSEQFEAFKKDMTETYEKNKDNQDFKDQLAKAKASIKPEEYDKMIDDAKKEAKATLEQIDKEKKEIEEHDKKLKELEDEINGGDEKDKEIRELKKQLEELKNNPPQTLASSASGVNPGGTPNNTGGEGEPDTKQEEKDLADKTKAAEDAKKAHEDAQKELDDLKGTLEGKDKDSQEYKDIQAKITEKEKSVADLKKASDDAEKAKNDAQTALDKKKKGGDPDPKDPKDPKGEPGGKKPEDYSNDEIDAMQDELSNLDPEKDKEKIKEKEDLLKSIAKAKGKDEKDLLPEIETGSDGKQYQKKTGPLGGKYYRPKTDNGWGEWQSGEPPKNESLHQFMCNLFY